MHWNRNTGTQVVTGMASGNPEQLAGHLPCWLTSTSATPR